MRLALSSAAEAAAYSLRPDMLRKALTGQNEGHKIALLQMR